MKDKKNKNLTFQDWDYSSAEQEDIRALSDYYGVKIKNRATKKPQKKFTEKRQK